MLVKLIRNDHDHYDHPQSNGATISHAHHPDLRFAELGFDRADLFLGVCVKEGTGGRWKTPAQKAKQAEKIEMGTALEVGDQGIWVTYARGMKGKAIREFKELCDEVGLFPVSLPLV